MDEQILSPIRPSFEAVYEQYYDRIYHYAYTLLRKREDAEDVTEETFLAAYRHYHLYDPAKASLGTWLARIAHNQAVNLLHTPFYARREDLPEDYEVPDPDSGQFQGQLEAADLIMHLYGQLKPRERELLNLRYVTDLKDKEIASLLHLPEKTVNKRLQRLLSKCRLILHNMEQENFL